MPPPAPRLDPRSTELPPLAPLSSGDASNEDAWRKENTWPRENTWPIPEREETTVAEDPAAPAKPPRHKLEELPDSFDEVVPGGEPMDALLGPIDEFTLSFGTTDPAAAERSDPYESRPTAPPSNPPPPRRPDVPAARSDVPPDRPRRVPDARRPPSRSPLADPLTTGVVDVPEELLRGKAPPLEVLRDVPARPGRLSDATAALVLDGLDELPIADPSIGLPDIEMPPPDTSRARGWAPSASPPAISIDPRAPSEDSGDVEVMEASLGPTTPPPPSSPQSSPPIRPEVRPAPRSAAPARSRPAPDVVPAREHAPATSAVALPSRGPAAAPSRPAPPRKEPGRPATSPLSAPVGGLDELLSLADEPPEREETIGGSLELLRMVDAPPEAEVSLGGSMERLEAPPVPHHVRPRATPPPPPPRAAQPPPPLEPLPSVHDASPVGEETLSRALEPVSPAEVRRRVPEPPLASLETRPIDHGDPATVALQHGASAAHRVIHSAQLRRPHYRPSGTPDTPPPAPRRSAPAPDAGGASPAAERPARPPRSEAPDDGPQSALQDPIVLGAASVIGLMLFVGAWIVVVFVLAWIV